MEGKTDGNKLEHSASAGSAERPPTRLNESREVIAFPTLSPHSGLSSVGASVLHSSLQKNPSSARVLCMATFEKGILLRTSQFSLCYGNKHHWQGGLDTTDADLHCPQS